MAVVPEERRREEVEGAAIEEDEDEDPEGDAMADREAGAVETALPIGARETSLATCSRLSVRTILLAGFII